MRILVVGQGGREHALVWKLGQSPVVTKLFCAPGNAGTAIDAENVAIPETDIPGLMAFARRERIDLTVVGPEGPLCAGIADEFLKAGLKVFGPRKQAAQLEGSKVFCKRFLRKAGIPTANFEVFHNAEQARNFLEVHEDRPVVVKADGLAAGKGVIVCANRAEGIAAINLIMVERAFGAAGRQIIIEDCLVGQEASILAIVDGNTIVPLEVAQDHKRAWDGDRGPNTGGMGAYCPAPLITTALMDDIIDHVFLPTVHQLRLEEIPFCGVLYAGIMLTEHGPMVLEYNTRFGDPETQPVLMRLKSDLAQILMAAAEQRLDQIPDLEWDPRPAVCVVMASEGYPGSYPKGREIYGLDAAAQRPDVKVFHAGTTLHNGRVTTSGGRVLGVTALGADLGAAKAQAYDAVRSIEWEGGWSRSDISDKALL